MKNTINPMLISNFFLAAFLATGCGTFEKKKGDTPLTGCSAPAGGDTLLKSTVGYAYQYGFSVLSDSPDSVAFYSNCYKFLTQSSGSFKMTIDADAMPYTGSVMGVYVGRYSHATFSWNVVVKDVQATDSFDIYASATPHMAVTAGKFHDDYTSLGAADKSYGSKFALPYSEEDMELGILIAVPGTPSKPKPLTDKPGTISLELQQ